MASHATSIGPVRTLSRGLQILQLFARAEADSTMRQVDVARLIGLPLPTVHRLLATLAAEGWLESVTPGCRYRRGPLLREFWRVPARATPAVALARPTLSHLAAETGETVGVGVLGGAHVTYLDVVVGDDQDAVPCAAAERFPSHCVAAGLCLLARLEDGEVRSRLGGAPYQRCTPSSPAVWPLVRERLERVRRTSVAVSTEECRLGVTTVAVALQAGHGTGPMAVELSVPSHRATSARLRHLVRELRSTAARLDRCVGEQGPAHPGSTDRWMADRPR